MISVDISTGSKPYEIERDGQQQDGKDIAHDEGHDRLVGPAGADGRKGERRGHAADGQGRGEFSDGHARKSGEKDDGLRDAVGKTAREDDRPGAALVKYTLHLVQRLTPSEALYESAC